MQHPLLTVLTALTTLLAGTGEDAPPKGPFMWTAESGSLAPGYGCHASFRPARHTLPRLTVTWWVDGTREDVPEVFDEQVEVTLFRPTAACLLARGRMLVAGIEPGGGSRVELWKLPAPALDPVAGYAFPRPAERTTVFRAPREDGRVVCALFALRGVQDQALVQLLGSRELFVLDLGSVDAAGPRAASWTLVMSPVSDAGAPVEPALRNDSCNHYWSATHDDLGHVYVFGYMDWRGMAACGAPVDPRPPGFRDLVLLDRDRDGVLDDRTTLSAEDWRRSPWSTSDGWTD